MNEVKNHVGSLSDTHKKNRSGPRKWTSSVFIVLAGQMKNSQHWRGYQQAPA